MGTLNQSFIVFGMVILSMRSVVAADATLAKAKKLENSGDFKQATALLIDAIKKDGLSEDVRRNYEWEAEWMSRVQQDYIYSEQQLFQKLSASVKGLTQTEFGA